MDSVNCIEGCRCSEGSHSGTLPILGPFSGPWIGIEQWKQVHLGTSTAVNEPGCMAASSPCPLRDDPYDTTILCVGRPWVMPLSEQDLDSIGPMRATKESQTLRGQSLRNLANAQRDGSQNVDITTIFTKMSPERRRIRCKERRIVQRISNVPQPCRVEMHCAKRLLG